MKRGQPLRRTELKRDGEGARKFADSRGGSLNRNSSGESGLQRSSLDRSSRLKPRSAKRAKVYADERRPYIESLLGVGVGCEVGVVFEEYGIAHHCTGQLQGLHERRKRSSGGSLVHHGNLIPACNWCNGFIEDQPKLIRDMTGDLLVLREGDPEWEIMGARHDKDLDDDET